MLVLVRDLVASLLLYMSVYFKSLYRRPSVMDIKTLDRFLMTYVNIYFPFINAPISLKAFCTRCGKIFCAIKTKKVAKRKKLC